MGDERLNMSGSSNGFPLVSRPDFGLYTSSSSHSEGGGLGSVGLSALAAHSQFGTFSGRSNVLFCLSVEERRRIYCQSVMDYFGVFQDYTVYLAKCHIL